MSNMGVLTYHNYFHHIHLVNLFFHGWIYAHIKLNKCFKPFCVCYYVLSESIKNCFFSYNNSLFKPQLLVEQIFVEIQHFYTITQNEQI